MLSILFATDDFYGVKSLTINVQPSCKCTVLKFTIGEGLPEVGISLGFR